MAPKREKAEKVSAFAQEDMILNYLEQQNRPYSATDISANLHNKVTKSATQKILTKLHEAKKIEGRVSGKQSVYHSIQDPDNTPSPEKLAEMDTRTQLLRDETATLNAQAKTLRAKLAELSSTLSTADLRDQIAAMGTEKADIEARLASLRGGKVQPVSGEEKARVDAALKTVEMAVVARTKIVSEMWALIAEVVPREDWAGLKEDLGVPI